MPSRIVLDSVVLKVVLDTNVVVSALLKRDGRESQVLRLGLVAKFQLCVSPPVLAEYALVLPRPRLKLQAKEIDRVLAHLRQASEMVHPAHTLAISRDDADNRFLECAEAAEAAYLVTGNAKHFPVRWKSTRIVNARRLIEDLLQAG